MIRGSRATGSRASVWERTLASFRMMCIVTSMVPRGDVGYFFDVPRTSSVDLLRDMVSRRRQLPLDRVGLSYHDQQLRNGFLLATYGIDQDAIVDVRDICPMDIQLRHVDSGSASGAAFTRQASVSPRMELWELRSVAALQRGIPGVECSHFDSRSMGWHCRTPIGLWRSMAFAMTRSS